MADEIYRMEDLYAEDIADSIDEVRTARGEYDSLGERIDDIESGSFSPGTEIIGTDAEHQDLNSYTELGVYFCRNSTNAGYVDNKPVGGSGFRLTVENISGTNTFRQTFIKPTDPSKIYVRHYSTSTWSAWYVFEGTSVT